MPQWVLQVPTLTHSLVHPFPTTAGPGHTEGIGDQDTVSLQPQGWGERETALLLQVCASDVQGNSWDTTSAHQELKSP